MPYDVYRPDVHNPRTQIEIIQKDGSLAELSTLSPIVTALTGSNYGDRRLYFPKEMLQVDDLFTADKEIFLSYISNEHFEYNK